MDKFDFSKFEPSIEEKKLGMVTKNAIKCGICYFSVDRYVNRFQCQKNPNHIGDLNVGIFCDLTIE
jgi:hypothetical protein